MSDAAYQKAQRRRDELKQELTEIEEFLRLYKKIVGTEGGQIAPQPVEAAGALDLSPPVAKKRSAERNPPRRIIAKKAREFMIEHGRPMTRGQLVDAFDKAGTPIAGADRSKNMGTIMWRLNEQFVNIEGHGYWPRNVACPAVGYDPAIKVL